MDICRDKYFIKDAIRKFEGLRDWNLRLAIERPDKQDDWFDLAAEVEEVHLARWRKALAECDDK